MSFVGEACGCFRAKGLVQGKWFWRAWVVLGRVVLGPWGIVVGLGVVAGLGVVKDLSVV